MIQEKNQLLQYKDKQIALFSSYVDDYVNLTDMAIAWKNKKSILSWLRSTSTIEFLDAWEKRYNDYYNSTQLKTVHKRINEKNLTVRQWIDLTGARGIFTRTGAYPGTYAHVDIAKRFAAWLHPEFELYLTEELQKLKELERKKDSYELLNYDQILFLTRLNEVFKFITDYKLIEDAREEVYTQRSGAKRPFASFNRWRMKILDISPKVINKRIKQYCIDNNIALTSKMLKTAETEKTLTLQSYASILHAVWYFIGIPDTVSALNLENLVSDMVQADNKDTFKEDKTSSLQKMQDLEKFTKFEALVNSLPQIKSARQLVAYRKQIKRIGKENLSHFNKYLLKALHTNPKRIQK